jgi:hypothetical protein
MLSAPRRAGTAPAASDSMQSLRPDAAARGRRRQAETGDALLGSLSTHRLGQRARPAVTSRSQRSTLSLPGHGWSALRRGARARMLPLLVVLAVAALRGAVASSSPSCATSPTQCNDCGCLTELDSFGCSAYGLVCQQTNSCQTSDNAWMAAKSAGLCDQGLATAAGRWFSYAGWNLQVRQQASAVRTEVERICCNRLLHNCLLLCSQPSMPRKAIEHSRLGTAS